MIESVFINYIASGSDGEEKIVGAGQLLGQVLINGILMSGIYALAASGMALAFGVVKFLNLAHGEFLMLAAYFGIIIFSTFGLDPLLMTPIAFLLFFILGAIFYKILVKPVLNRGELNQLLLTFGLSILLQNLALLLFGGTIRTISVPYRTNTISFGGISFGMARLAVLIIAIILLVGLYQILQHTRVGRSIRAVSQEPEGAALIGIDSESVYLIALGIAIGFAAVAGMMLSVILHAEPMVGFNFTLKSLAVVVVAGLGNIYGVLWASLLLGISESLVSAYLPNGTGWSEAVFFLMILIVLVFRRSGVSEA